MFKVQKDEHHTGFQMMFDNGWTVSVQFGVMCYSSNQNKFPFGTIPYRADTAEIAAWDENGVWYQFDENNTVKGWCGPNEVADFIAMVKGF